MDYKEYTERNPFLFKVGFSQCFTAAIVSQPFTGSKGLPMCKDLTVALAGVQEISSRGMERWLSRVEWAGGRLENVLKKSLTSFSRDSSILCGAHQGLLDLYLTSTPLKPEPQPREMEHVTPGGAGRRPQGEENLDF